MFIRLVRYFASASRLWAGVIVPISCLCSGVLAAQAQTQTNDTETRRDAPRVKTESPYFFVPGGDPSIDALPLKSTQVQVNISGVIADVSVTQTYKNQGQRPIEAQYIFPGSTRAAVYAMQVQLGQRTLTAQIREKAQAQAEFDSAKQAGKTAALLSQHLPHVFQMNVANILPGDEVKVQLRYTELLVPQAGQYQFVFPTVVGPRYNSPTAHTAAKQPPFLPQGQASPATFDMQVALATPLGIKDLLSPSHEIAVQQKGADAQRATVTLRKPHEAAAKDRDFILDYRLTGDGVASGVMLYQGAQGPAGTHENFFLAMVQPPRRVSAQQITPREYIFVVDISGSMHGFPLDTAKSMLRELIGGLKTSDHFNVLLFSGSNRLLSPQSVPATPANIQQALQTIDQMGGGGSTELMPALRRVYANPKAADTSRTVVVVTDGFVAVERDAFALVRQNLAQANVFAFGIGSSVNRHLIEGLARAGMGEPFVVTHASQAAEKARQFRQMVEAPVLTGVTARFEGLDVYDVQPLALPDVLAVRPVLVFGKLRGNAGGQLVVQGRSASGPYNQTVQIPSHLDTHTMVKDKNGDTSALRYLWARHRIADLSDQEALEGGSAQRKAITELGLQYNLLTQYTSFLAVDQVVRNTQAGDTPTVNQPVPLPQGVSNLAVGGEVPSTPEPEALGAVLVMLSVLAMLARRRRRQRSLD